MNPDSSGRPIHVLLVEDNPGDVRLIREALTNDKIILDLHVAVDGVEAWEFLKRRRKHASAPRPDIILLDLNLPKKDGQELLSDIKNDDALKAIPVVVLTSSEAERDIVASYNNHANCYVTKPIDLNSFISIVRSVKDFWLAIVKLPPREGE